MLSSASKWKAIKIVASILVFLSFAGFMYEWQFSPIRRIYSWGRIKFEVEARSENENAYASAYQDILTIIAIEDPSPKKLVAESSKYGIPLQVRTINTVELSIPYDTIWKTDSSYIKDKEYRYPFGTIGIQEQHTNEILLNSKSIKTYTNLGDVLTEPSAETKYKGELELGDVENKIRDLWKNFVAGTKKNSISEIAPFLTEQEQTKSKDLLKIRDLEYKLGGTIDLIIDIEEETPNEIIIGKITLSIKDCKAKPQLKIVYNKETRQYEFSGVQASVSLLCNKPIPLSPILSCSNCWLAPVSRKYSLSSSYIPYVVSTGVNGGGYVTPETKIQLQKMISAAEAAGLTPRVSSSYRSYTVQKNLFYSYVSREQVGGLTYSEAYAKANTYSALPGQSEHQLGTTVDILNCGYPCSFYDSRNNVLNTFFTNNAHKYGFVISYPNGSQAYTGYVYEPWHLRYIGVSLATELYNKGYLKQKGYYSYNFLLEKRMW